MIRKMEYLLDSFAWLEYFGGNELYAPFIEKLDGGLPFTVITSITEVARSLLRKGFSKKDISKAVEFMYSKSMILQLDRETAVSAAFIAEERKLHFSDALIYSFASGKRRLVTGDRHFEGFENVEFVV